MTPGFTTIDNDSVIARLPEIGGSAAMVFLVLAHRANGARECWPSLATIGKETRLKRRTVQYAITRLVELDLIAVEQQQGKPTTYCLTRAPSCTPTEPGECTGMHPPVHLRAPTRAPTCTDPCTYVHPNKKQEQQPRTTTRNKTQRGKAAVAVVEIPKELDSPEFQAAWSEWLQHRREIKKPATPTAQRKALAALTVMGPARAIAAINHSVANGWQGIFEPNGESTNGIHGKHHPRGAGGNGPGQRHTPGARVTPI